MAARSLQAGSVGVRVLDDGTFITDAGTVLGGGKSAKIRGAMRPVLAETGNGLALLDAGFGPELPESLRGSYELRREENLIESLRKTGHEPEDVSRILLSHLDADHVGWALRSDGFPNATVYVQRDALEEARRLAGSERHEAVGPVERGLREGWVELLDGDAEVVPGIEAEVRSGHAEGHQIFWIGDEEEAVLFTADLAPARIWLDPDLISGVDTDPEAARRNRVEVLAEAERRNAPVILYHEPRDFVVTIRRSEGKFEGVPYEG